MVLGDIYRVDGDLHRARNAYHRALADEQWSPAAHHELAELRKLGAPRVALGYYQFKDTDDFQQSGIFSSLNFFLGGGAKAAAHLNRWFFEQRSEDMERNDAGVSVDYRLSREIVAAAGVTAFKTESHDPKYGGNLALYLTPAPALNAWVSYRHREPVNDSFLTARDAFTQNIVAGGLNVFPTSLLNLSFTGSTAAYSDGNTRRWALGSVGYTVAPKWNTAVKLEYEWLDFTRRSNGYSSPSNYALLRPVLEMSPRITDWLTLQIRGEVPFVFDEGSWGYGVTIGPRFNIAEAASVTVLYINHEIPGGQTNWSGDGFKIDFSYRF